MPKIAQNPPVGLPLYSTIGALTGAELIPMDKATSGTTWTTVKASIAALFSRPGLTINVPATNQQFVGSGAIIQRLNDRVMVGDACVNDCAFPNVIQDWLSAFQTSQAGGPANGTLLGVQMAVLADHSTPMGGAFLAGAESINATSSGPDVISISSFAVNNSPSYQIPAWAFYGEAHRMNNTTGQTVGIELDVVQRGSLQQMTPYAQAGGEAICYIAAAGAGLSATGQYNATAAFVTGANPMPFDKGIVFQATSIAGTNGVTGTGYAINLAAGHVIQWWGPGGVPTGAVVGNGTTYNNSVTLVFTEDQFDFLVRANSISHSTLSGNGSAAIGWNGVSHSFILGAAGNATISSPTSGQALTVNGVSGAYTTEVAAPNSAGSSYGLYIQAGTNSGDVSFKISNATGGSQYLQVSGDGGLVLGAGTDEGLGTINANGGIWSGYANYMISSTVAWTAGATGNIPTLTSGPVTGNPTKWIAINDNGTVRHIPAW
jgi:hypothetical protein